MDPRKPPDRAAPGKAEEALRESEALYRALVENTKDILFSMDLEGKLTYLSPQALEYGIDPAEAVSKSVLELIAPEDRERVAADMQRTLTTGEEFLTEFRVTKPDGSHAWLEEHGSLQTDSDGNPIRTVGMIRDITDRKEAQQELTRTRALLESAIEQVPAGLLIARAPDFELLFWNSEAQKIQTGTRGGSPYVPGDLDPDAWVISRQG
jgi:PAS domain S-box-containing protein